MNRTSQYQLAIMLCAAMTLSLPSSAISQDGYRKDVRQAALDNERGTDAGQEKWEHDPIVFSVRDRDTIRNYYRGADSKLAHRNGALSPALRKPLRRNGTLPTGLQKLLEPLAGEIESHLQALDSGYSRGMVGQDVVIVENRTQRVMDIIRDVTVRR
jgi:hypothetical protein